MHADSSDSSAVLTADLSAGSRAAAGEPAAFEELVSAYHVQVFRWAVVAAEDADDADDIAQLVWIKVYRGLKRYQGSAKFSTWLYRITFNTAVEGKRTRSRRLALIGSMVERGELPMAAEVKESIDASKLAEIVRGYLHHLPARQRSIFALADFEGVPAGEIAERLEMPEVTVRANLFKARRAIRERLLREAPKLTEEYRS